MFYLIENDTVVAVSESKFDVHPSLTWVEDAGDYKQGATYQNGVFTNPPEPEVPDAAESMRIDRNERLAETDWWALSDSPEMTQEQIDYRQALRDLPAQDGFPNIDFPVKP